MKFSVSATELAAALTTVTRALSARTTNPILDGVLIDARGDGVKLTCFDGSTAISMRVAATVDADGRAVAPGKLFTEIVRRSSNGLLTVSVSAKHSFKISGNGSRVNLAGLSADAYPTPDNAEGELGRKVTLPQAVLREMFAKTLPVVPTAEMREVLTGCCLDARGGDVTMVGMDGFRMAKVTHRSSAISDEVSAIIPAKAAGELQRLLKSDDGLCVMEVGEHALRTEIDGVSVYTRLIAGEYVDYARVTPTSFAINARANTAALQDCIARAGIVAKDGGTRLLRFRVEDDQMIIESNSETASVREELPVAKSGDDITISFNINYVTDALRTMDTPEVNLAFNSPVTPCVITAPDQGDHIALILPVRTSD